MTDERALTNAQAFAAWGFGVFSVWGVDGGICRCPKGPDCTSPGKHPIPIDGLKSATTDEGRVAKMLAAAGSQGQYGVVPAANVIVLDVDGEGWVEKLRTLRLPKTLAVRTANGVHLYFHWPESHGPQPTRLFDWVVRSTQHPGYVIGPGSIHQTGVEYAVAHQNGHDIHEMLATIAMFPVERIPSPEGEARTSITMSEGLRPPERVPVGGRHDYLRDRARTLRGGGLTGTDLFDAVSALNRRLPEPKSDEEVLRAIGDVEVKFGEDPLPPPAPHEAVVAAGPLIIPAPTYVANTDRHPRWCSPLAVFGNVSLVSGPAKSGKSTLIGGLVRAREAGRFYLWGDPIPVGPTLYISEESGVSFADKLTGLTTTEVLDWSMFVRAGLSTRDHALALITDWCANNPSPLILVDTLAIWGAITDENDASETTRALASFNVIANVFDAALVMVHHSRKGSGEYGEGIRGSSAIFGTVAQSVEFKYAGDHTDTRRRVVISGRFASVSSHTLDFDENTREYEQTFAAPTYDELTKHLPLTGSGPGMSRADLKGIWGKDPRNDIAKLLRAGQIIESTEKVDRVTRTVYHRAPPLLDTGSVSERMGRIFRRDES